MAKLKSYLLVILLGLSVWIAPVFADNILQNHLENPQKIGQARYSALGLKIYDGVLYAPHGTFEATSPLALKFTYLRSLDGDKIAKRSVVEIRKLGFVNTDKLEVWQSALFEIFPDVEKGDSIIGVRDAQGITWFYGNKKGLLGKMPDKEFGKWFFDIWLSEKTSAPEFRKTLLGMN